LLRIGSVTLFFVVFEFFVIFVLTVGAFIGTPNSAGM
jgi:hypothetical protein